MAEKRTFEKTMSELETVVRQLESSNLSLDESLLQFERGIALTRECESLLNEAKGKVEKLIRDSAGNLKTEAFEPKE